MSDAKERLRQYLEQRRELGESEFVLDSMSVEDALRVLGGKAGAKGEATGGDARAAATPSAERPAPRPPESDKRRAAEAAAEGGDWREALRKVDAGEEQRSSSEKKSSPKWTAPKTNPLEKASSGKSGATTGATTGGTPGASGKSVPPPPGEPRVIGEGAARSQLTQLTTLAEVRTAIASCTACELAAGAKNPVPGEGDPDAKFVIVGEAPGATEDELGKPFVGRSGDLLTKILEAIGLKREEVFICNVLKHRPPGNRNPSTAEIHACRPFLLRQLELLQPRVILALGTFAAQTLLETDSPIGKLRGVEHRYHGIPLVATYHPAALLRNPNWKRPAWEDVQLARRILDRA